MKYFVRAGNFQHFIHITCTLQNKIKFLNRIHTYQIGEVFVTQNLEATQALVEGAKQKTQGEIDDIEGQCKDIKETLTGLKAQLYAKFGTNINLELEEEG